MSGEGAAGHGWALHPSDDAVLLSTAAGIRRWDGAAADELSIARRWFRWYLVAAPGTRVSHLKGLRGANATALQSQMDIWARQRLTYRRLRSLRVGLEAEVTAVETWRSSLDATTRDATGARRWLPHDEAAALALKKPRAPRLRELALHPEGVRLLSLRERQAAKSLALDTQTERRTANALAERELVERHQHLLATIEKSPLTSEQASAVVCFDNRVQVVAAAGSGKTSVMIARTAYSIVTELVPAHRILLLAFNSAAAVELQTRIDARLGGQLIPTEGLVATTFHSFGLSLIGQVTGVKPRLASWLDDRDGVPMIGRIVDDLRESSMTFRYQWDLYRLLFARTGDSPEGEPAEWWDKQTDVAGHRTLRGETVRSQGEKLIGDWLYLNGVNYDYERPYAFPVADARHSQYRPDFYYPDIDVWHEHWAIGKDGRPPAAFVGYAEAMEWKRTVHAEHGTTLLETSWADIIDHSGFEGLERDLQAHGVRLDWNPDRPTPGANPVEHEELARLMRVFLGHAKSSGFSRADLTRRLESQSGGVSRYRARLFLDLFWPIYDRWQALLRAEDLVDYEDMLIRAAELLESGRATSGYDLVLVDEFQDSSVGRARLVRALTQGPGKYLLAVGDDWQSIYRFAGADVSVMTDFDGFFGPSEVRRLQTTFRSPQSISDAASTFVSKNPAQIAKKVRSAHGVGGPDVRLATVTARDPNRPEPELRQAVKQYLEHLASRLVSGDISRGPTGEVSVDVLGRYGFERNLLPDRVPPGLAVSFRTVHGAKGLEADYVLLPRVIDGTLGFPNRLENDPVLDLVMSRPDSFPHGEERRLFYVALTRARCEVALITVSGKESPFVVEMLKDRTLVPVAGYGQARPQPCPACGRGLLVQRSGKFGDFLACARFPACRFTRSWP